MGLEIKLAVMFHYRTTVLARICAFSLVTVMCRHCCFSQLQVCDEGNRIDCGFPGVLMSECTTTRGCCWVPSERYLQDGTPQCYFPTGPSIDYICDLNATTKWNCGKSESKLIEKL